MYCIRGQRRDLQNFKINLIFYYSVNIVINTCDVSHSQYGDNTCDMGSNYNLIVIMKPMIRLLNGDE